MEHDVEMKALQHEGKMGQTVNTMIENVDDSSKEEDHWNMGSIKEVEKISIYEEDRNIALGETIFFLVIGKQLWNQTGSNQRTKIAKIIRIELLMKPSFLENSMKSNQYIVFASPRQGKPWVKMKFIGSCGVKVPQIRKPLEIGTMLIIPLVQDRVE